MLETELHIYRTIDPYAHVQLYSGLLTVRFQKETIEYPRKT